MSFLPEPIGVTFRGDAMTVALEDGRSVTVPVGRYPLLSKGTPEQRLNYWLSPDGVHWDDLDEDISVEGLMAVGTVSASPRHVA